MMVVGVALVAAIGSGDVARGEEPTAEKKAKAYSVYCRVLEANAGEKVKYLAADPTSSIREGKARITAAPCLYVRKGTETAFQAAGSRDSQCVTEDSQTTGSDKPRSAAELGLPTSFPTSWVFYFRVKVDAAEGGKVHLNASLESIKPAMMSKTANRWQGKILRAAETVSLGEPVKLMFEEDDERMWIEFVIQEECSQSEKVSK
jgi:hypothetical protein